MMKRTREMEKALLKQEEENGQDDDKSEQDRDIAGEVHQQFGNQDHGCTPLLQRVQQGLGMKDAVSDGAGSRDSTAM